MDDAEALREGEVVGVGADDVLAAVEVEHDPGLLQRRDVIVEAADADRRGGEEAVAVGGLAALDGVGLERDDDGLVVVGAEGRGDGADRPHPGEAAMAPLHRLGPGEIGDDARQDIGQEPGGLGALLFDDGDVGVALFGVGDDFGVGKGGKAGGAQESVDRGLRRADARALLFLAQIGRARRNARNGKGQAARRGEGAGPLIEQAGLDQRVGDGLPEVVGGAALETGGDFLGEQFKQQFRHVGDRSSGPGRGSKRGRGCPFALRIRVFGASERARWAGWEAVAPHRYAAWRGSAPGAGDRHRRRYQAPPPAVWSQAAPQALARSRIRRM